MIVISLALVAGWVIAGEWLWLLINRRLQTLRIYTAALTHGHSGMKLAPRPGGFLELQETEDAVYAAVRHLEQARERAESADRAKSTFLATINHELRTPLNSILGFSNMLARMKLETPEHEARVREYADLIQEGGKRFVTLVDDLIDMTAIESGQLHVEPQRLNVARSSGPRDRFHRSPPEGPLPV